MLPTAAVSSGCGPDISIRFGARSGTVREWHASPLGAFGAHVAELDADRGLRRSRRRDPTEAGRVDTKRGLWRVGSGGGNRQLRHSDDGVETSGVSALGAPIGDGPEPGVDDSSVASTQRS